MRDGDDFSFRQILASVNYQTGTPLRNFLHGYMNYHIEHHLFPDLPLRQLELAQSRLKAICNKHGVPYRQESVRIPRPAPSALGRRRRGSPPCRQATADLDWARIVTGPDRSEGTVGRWQRTRW